MKVPLSHIRQHVAVLAAALPLIVLARLWNAGAATAEQTGLPARRVIVVGGDHNYPPYEFLNADGQPDGYNVEMTMAIAKVMGIEVEIRLGPWDQIREKLESGEIDIVQGMIKSAERDRYFDFAAPCAIISRSIFARNGGPGNITLEDLNGKEVIVQSGGFMQEFLRERAPRDYDYCVETGALSRIIGGVTRAVETVELRRANPELRERFLGPGPRDMEVFSSIITRDKAIPSILSCLEAVAKSPRPILITGESGTVKEPAAATATPSSGPREGWSASRSLMSR